MVNRPVPCRAVLAASLILAVVAADAPAQGPTAGRPSAPPASEFETIRDGFETPEVSWRQEQTDATVRLFAHARTNRAAHEGLTSEGFQFEAGIGGGFYFSYPLPKIPVTDDLRIGLYVRSNRSGMQILARVVLPDDVDPDSRRPSFVLVPGAVYENVDRWQALVLEDLLPSVERQARVLRASTRRPVSLKGAYLERLVVNLYGGQGETEVYLDELTVGPVPADLVKPAAPDPSKGPVARMIADRPRRPDEPLEPLPAGANSRITLDRNRLAKDGYPWFFTAVRAPGANPSTLRSVGIDALVVPKGTDEATIRAAIASGLALIPELTGPEDRSLPDADRLVGEAASFLGRDAVAFWSLGENLGRSPDLGARSANLRRARDAILAFRKARPGGSPFVTATVSGMLADYARVPENLDVVGVPTQTWATVQEPFELYQFLEQRRLMTVRSNADTLFWPMIEVAAPPIYQETIWGTDNPPGWGYPQIQPEQIRLATYAAIAGGCRGICYRGDADLTREVGRMNRIEVALLNEEIDLLEPILADPDKSVRMVDVYLPDPPPPPMMTLFQMNTGFGGTSTNKPVKEFPANPTVKAAAITTKDRRGTLLMIADYYKYAQFQPPQSASNNVVLLVPAPTDAQAFLISPGGVKPLDSRDRGPGGKRIVLDDFGVTAIVLVTTNLELVRQIEQAVNANRAMAVNFAIEQAELQRAKVAEIDSLLRDRGHPQRDAADLLKQSGEFIATARQNLEREDYQNAWDEARRASRPLRILMRYHFMEVYDALIKALRDEDLPCGPTAYKGQKKPKPRIIQPIVAPPLCSFDTLPQAWIWCNDWIKPGKLGRNLVPSGNFEDPNVLKTGGWTPVGYETEELLTEYKLYDNDGKGGGPSKKGTNLVLVSKQKPGMTFDSQVPYVDHPVAAIRSPAVKVGASQVYRISVMAYMTNGTNPGAGGLIVRDSIGGERLQFRTSNALAVDWFEIVMYRRAPEDGTMTVTLGLAGIGFAAFDDFKIEPIVETISEAEVEQIEAMHKAKELARRKERVLNKDEELRRKEKEDKEAAEGKKTDGDDPDSKDDPNKPKAATANRLSPYPIRQ